MKKILVSLIIIIGFMSQGFSQDKIKLPPANTEGKVSLEKVLNERRSIRDYTSGALTLEEISQLLWASYGKNKWNKLTSPSAGALYPLVIYLVAANVEGVASGFYKYDNMNHSLILLSTKDLRSPLCKASLNQPWVKDAAAIIVICADYKVTTSGYGQRGRRYVDIEVGHVGQNIYLESTALGLGTVAVGAFYDKEVKKVINVDQDPLYLMPIGRIK